MPNPTIKGRAINDIAKRMEEIISEEIGVEVRHISTWDGLMPGEKRKRGEEEQHHPVVAFRRDGADFHAAFMGIHDSGQDIRVRIGMGPGPRTDTNHQRLKARQMEDVDDVFNQFYFDQGGIDAFGENYFGPGDEEKIDFDPERDLKWLEDEFTCTLEAEGGLENDSPGMWWGVLDHSNTLTYASGAMAAVYPEHESFIQYMTYEGHLDIATDCTVPDAYYDGV